MATPCVLLASGSAYQPAELVKDILGGELPPPDHVMEEIYRYPWHVETKYYTADIQLCTSATRTFGDEDFASSVQAFVLYFDSNEESSFTQVKCWLPFLKVMEPQVQILVCRSSTLNDVVPRQRVLAWCLENGFELVEMETEPDSDSDVEDVFQETNGVKRIIQALHAHPWPNLVMKDQPSFRSPFMEQMIAEEVQQRTESSEPSAERIVTTDLSNLSLCESISEKTRKDLQNLEQKHNDLITDVGGACGGVGEEAEVEESSNSSSTQTQVHSSRTEDVSNSKEDKKRRNEEVKQGSTSQLLAPDLMDELALLSSLGDEDDGGESFENLFARMREMKDRAESLPAEQRKAYAEQVAVAFWQAIGGDMEEIEGISEDDAD